MMREKHTNKTYHRHNHLIPPSSISVPTSPFQYKSHSTTTSHIQNKIFMLLYLNHSTLTPHRKVTILTPAKVNNIMRPLMRSLYSSLYSHTLHLKTESYPTLQFCVDGVTFDGVILYIGECEYILKVKCCDSVAILNGV